jgi:hypothetical protein
VAPSITAAYFVAIGAAKSRDVATPRRIGQLATSSDGSLLLLVLAEFEGGLGAPDLVHEIRCPRDEGFVHALITVVVAINVVDEGRGIPWTVSAVSQWQD